MELLAIQYLLWVSLVIATGYSSKCPFGFTAHYQNNHHQYHITRRSDLDNISTYQHQDSANARSIPVSSDLQRIQEQERRRIGINQRQKPETVMRTGNSSKIVNRYPVRFTDSKRGSEEEPMRDSVVFPGPTHSSQSFVPTEIPEDCMDNGFCEEVPNYPEEHVASIISRLGNDRKIYKVDILDQSIEIAQRIGPPDEFELCNSREKLAILKAVECNKGDWRYLVNDKNKPLQSFRVETCLKRDMPCDSIANFRFGYVAYCKQKFVKRYMTVLDVNTGESVEEACALPSCCSCVVKHSR